MLQESVSEQAREDFEGIFKRSHVLLNAPGKQLQENDSGQLAWQIKVNLDELSDKFIEIYNELAEYQNLKIIAEHESDNVRDGSPGPLSLLNGNYFNYWYST